MSRLISIITTIFFITEYEKTDLIIQNNQNYKIFVPFLSLLLCYYLIVKLGILRKEDLIDEAQSG